jgi:hypothetical protein
MVKDLIDANSRRYGQCFATERAMREMLAEHGVRVGARSVARVERKLAAKGIIRRRRVMPNGGTVRGHYSKKGTTVRALISRQEQRATRRKRAKAKRALERAAHRLPPNPPKPRPIVEPNGQLTLTDLARHLLATVLHKPETIDAEPPPTERDPPT